MKPVFAIVTGIALAGATAAALPHANTARAKTAAVSVHCSNGKDSAFVTPARVRIALGDTVTWRMAGNVASDSIIISLKNTQQAWPFAGSAPRGGAVARASAARTKGTFSYNVDLRCRVPGGGTRAVRIDPDIIIE